MKTADVIAEFKKLRPGQSWGISDNGPKAPKKNRIQISFKPRGGKLEVFRDETMEAALKQVKPIAPPAPVKGKK